MMKNPLLLHTCCLLCLGCAVERNHGENIGYVYPLKNITATVGDDVILRCKIFSPGIYKKRSWTFHSAIVFANDSPWSKHPRIQLVSDGVNDYTMRLKDVSTDDEGPYTCTVYPNATYSTLYLTVNVPPVFTDVTANLKVDEGSDVTLKCKSKGKPQPKIKWRHLIPSVDGVRATEEELPLGKVSRGSGGRYECMADNGVSFPIKHFIQLTVNYPPEIDVDISKSRQDVPLGRPASIECVAWAVPKPEFTWHHPAGRIIQKTNSNTDYSVVNAAQDNSVRSTLFISSLKLTDYGSYTCVASNRLGKADAALTVKQKILPPTRQPPVVVFNRLVSMDEDSPSDAPCSSRFNRFSVMVVVVISTCFIAL